METTRRRRWDTIFLTTLDVNAQIVICIGSCPIKLTFPYTKYNINISHMPREITMVIQF